MIAAVAPVAALLLSVAFLLMGNGLQGTLIPVRADLEAFAAFELGILGSSYFFGFALGCVWGPYLVRRAGHIRTFTAMVAIASSVSLLHALVVTPPIWWVLRAGTGFCFAVLYTVIESWLNEKSTNDTRGLVFSIYTIVNLTVITLGQLMLTLDDPLSFPLFALSSILISLAAVPVAMTTTAGPRPIAAVRIRLGHLYRMSPAGVVGCLAVGLANGTFWSLGPVFAQRGEGGTTTDVAFFMSLAVISGAIGQWPLGGLSDRVDRRKIMVVACLGAALAAVALTVFAQLWDGGILSVACLFGLFAFPLYAVSVAHTNDFIEPEGYVEAAGGLLLVYAIGAVVGPFLASIVIGFVGVDSLFGFTACVHLSAAAFLIHRMRVRRPRPMAEHITFADALRVAQTVSNVDPLSPAVNDDWGSRHQAGTGANGKSGQK